MAQSAEPETPRADRRIELVDFDQEPSRVVGVPRQIKRTPKQSFVSYVLPHLPPSQARHRVVLKVGRVRDARAMSDNEIEVALDHPLNNKLEPRGSLFDSRPVSRCPR